MVWLELLLLCPQDGHLALLQGSGAGTHSRVGYTKGGYPGGGDKSRYSGGGDPGYDQQYDYNSYRSGQTPYSEVIWLTLH